MSDIILQIGTLDMSDSVICENLNVSTAPVYSSGFTAVTGVERKKCLGVKISLSANFKVIDDTTAAALVAACNADTVDITYRFPAEVTHTFDRPTIKCSPVFEDDESVMYWNITLSASCPLAGDGL